MTEESSSRPAEFSGKLEDAKVKEGADAKFSATFKGNYLVRGQSLMISGCVGNQEKMKRGYYRE